MWGEIILKFKGQRANKVWQWKALSWPFLQLESSYLSLKAAQVSPRLESFCDPLLRRSKPTSKSCLYCHYTHPGNPSLCHLQWDHFRAWLCLIYYILVIWQDMWHLCADNEQVRESQAQQRPGDAEAPMLGRTSVLGTALHICGESRRRAHAPWVFPNRPLVSPSESF